MIRWQCREFSEAPKKAFKVGYRPGELGNAPREPYMQKRICVRSFIFMLDNQDKNQESREAFGRDHLYAFGAPLFYCSSVEISERLFKYGVQKGSYSA